MVYFSLLFCFAITQTSPGQTGPGQTGPGQAFAELGREVYFREGICATCHGADGLGVPGQYPRIANTFWINDREDRLIKILLHGFVGPVDGASETYPDTMEPLGGKLDDREIAAVLTFVRSSWGNVGGPIDPRAVTNLRRKYASRTEPWTARDLEYTREEARAVRPEPPKPQLNTPLMLGIVIVANVVVIAGLIAIYRFSKRS